MGLLSEGTPLSWPDSTPFVRQLKHDAISQFLSRYHDAKGLKSHGLKWGDEVEYMLVHLDTASRKATLSLRAPAILDLLQREENAQPATAAIPTLWRPEYANWMIEGTPGIPYRCYAADLVNVERNMMLRRRTLASLLEPCETALTITAFPRIGCAQFTTPKSLPFGPVALSFFTSDDVINPHPRFPTLTSNIRLRRGAKIHIRLPLFLDSNTAPVQPLIPADPHHLELLREASKRLSARSPALKNHDEELDLLQKGLNTTVDREVVMDATSFGMGSCCLQVTLQGRGMGESRYLYDQLAVMAPLMLALTAATPAIRGVLVDTDVRWDVISASMDDRSPEEVSSGSVPKSRYSSIDCFLSESEQNPPDIYNDLPIPIDESAYNRLREGGVDHLLAQHVAHLFIRDPIVTYAEGLNQDNTTSMDHFENIQSTNWNTVRFKVPPPGTDIGWRTEFRSMEVGVTDFENAAFSVFMVILSRVILAFSLDFYVPMSKVDSNMATAHKRDAVTGDKFFFRKNIFPSTDGSGFLCDCGHIHNVSLVGGQCECVDIQHFCHQGEQNGASKGTEAAADVRAFEQMTMDEIFNGKPLCRDGKQRGFEFPGLIPLMRGYLDALNLDCATRRRLLTYLEFVSQRASGALRTNASYNRDFIRQHCAYRFDSVVSGDICYDLMEHLQGITDGDIVAPQLLGDFHQERLQGEMDTADTMMARMQKTWEGSEGRLLMGSSMPKSALRNTIVTIAGSSDDAKCGC